MHEFCYMFFFQVYCLYITAMFEVLPSEGLKEGAQCILRVVLLVL